VSALALICAAWLSTFCCDDAGSDCSDKSHARAEDDVVLNHVVCDSSYWNFSFDQSFATAFCRSVATSGIDFTMAY